jgi:hypothetical protein
VPQLVFVYECSVAIIIECRTETQTLLSRVEAQTLKSALRLRLRLILGPVNLGILSLLQSTLVFELSNA